MARNLGVQYPGAIYHVMNGGDHREPIFRSTRDRELFLEALGQGWIAQALCMGTNTHLAHLLYWQGKPKKSKRTATA